MHSVTPKTPKPLFVQCNPILSLESCYAAPPLSLLPQHKPTCFCHLWLSSPRGLAANVEVDVALCWLRETCRGRRAVSYAVCVGVQFVWELGMWVVCGPCQGMWRKALGVIVILLLYVIMITAAYESNILILCVYVWCVRFFFRVFVCMCTCVRIFLLVRIILIFVFNLFVPCFTAMFFFYAGSLCLLCCG